MEPVPTASVSMRIEVNDPEYQANKKTFTELLETETPHLNYRVKVEELVRKQIPRLLIDLNDLRMFRSDIASLLIHRPMPFIPAFEDALNFVSSYINEDTGKKIGVKTGVPFKIGFTGSFGSHKVSPRQLNADKISSLVCVEGIVTRCSLVRPKIVSSVHYCSATHQFSTNTYTDATSFHSSIHSSPFFPKKDDDGNALTTEFGLCTYKNHQSITIQEMPEKAPSGQMPCSVEVIVDDDLVDACKPGDRIQICGVFRALAPGAANGKFNFKTMVIANSIKHIGRNASSCKTITKDDISSILKIASRQDVFELLSRSIAPSVYGHDYVKKALLLTLIGGAEKNLATGTHLRGDINMLMVGDPSTAKSQLLRCVLNIAPLAISTTGRGSSGVGLTAAVTQDKDTGERRLEAGAMVLADRGIVCIDEFDKMSDADRTAIHEVMEQQTVTIAKAGIHTSLNARCSVVAAANPIYGQYDDRRKPHDNIGLPDSILSRFDLLFIVLDQMDPEVDRRIADHVLGLHQFVCSSRNVSDSLDDEGVQHDDLDSPLKIFQKYNRVLHGNISGDVLTAEFLKRYIQFIKARHTMPRLTSESSDFIAESYCRLRSREDHAVPVTARLLETIIRLATAHARCRLAKEVLLEDSQIALEILNYAMFQEGSSELSANSDEENMDAEITRNKNPTMMSQNESRISVDARRLSYLRSNPDEDRHRARGSDCSDSQPVEDPEHFSGGSRLPKQRRLGAGLSVVNCSANGTGEPEKNPEVDRILADGSGTIPALDRPRFNIFQKALIAFVKTHRLNPCAVTQAIAGVNASIGSREPPFGLDEVELYLEIIQSHDRLMYVDGLIYFT